MKFFILTLGLFLSFLSFGQNGIDGESITFRQYKKTFPNTVNNFGVQGDLNRIIGTDSVFYKYSTGDWHFIRCTPSVLSSMLTDGTAQQVYFAPSRPKVLNDTMRIVQNIDSVHNGEAPLIGPFTGKGVIIGYVDTGIDWNHADFKNADGSTRVLYYWDQTLAIDPLLTPWKYGYGQVWDSTSINNGTSTSLDNNAHGTTVSGAGSGNGLATGTHKGAAPESDIIIVESNFSSANWTLSVADAIDFIFSMADTLGKPAVVNTSIGDYLGSHDGRDPAGQIVDSLLNDKAGRIVVAAAGNSGAQGKYHVNATVNADTSFCWFIVNPSSAFGGDAVYFDLWADTADFNNVEFAFGADNISPFQFRSRTQFYNIQTLLGVTTFDSIMVASDKLSPVEFYSEEVNGMYHIELLLLNPDSNTYYYRFETFGAGEYDLWSGAWLGASDIASTGLPLVGAFPDIAYYNMPDSLNTIVSSWTCLESVVTVGNFKNQYDYQDYNNNQYIVSGGPPGALSPNSSKGPNRSGYQKPDISATGDGIMSACPLWLSATLVTSNPSMLAVGGQHVRNGGTSMASPVVAGIAALYLEKCPESTHQDFVNDIQNYAYLDGFTGPSPNNAYGYGKVNAFYMLNQSNFDVTLLGDTLICFDPEVYISQEDNFANYLWYDGQTSNSISLDQTDTVFLSVFNNRACQANSDTIFVIKGDIPDFPMINILGGGLITTPADSYLWYVDGDSISDSNSQYYDPDTTGYFSVEVFSEQGCSYLSDSIFIDLSSITELDKSDFIILPNPFKDEFHIIKSDFYNVDLYVTDISGRIVYQFSDINSSDLFITVSLPYLPSGVYMLNLYYSNSFKSFKLVKE